MPKIERNLSSTAYSLRPEVVRELLDYNPDTGVFVWKSSDIRPATWNARWPGRVAGSSGGRGYWLIGILHDGDTRKYNAAVLAWAIVRGEWPAGIVDHINRDRADNRWANLREVDFAQNSWNTKTRADNKLGVPGIFRHGRMFILQVGARGKRYRASFPSLQEAIDIRNALVGIMHGEFGVVANQTGEQT